MSEPASAVSATQPRALNPGEQVYLQGERTSNFYGVLTGRFAKVRTRQPPGKVGMAKALAQAELVEILERPHTVFGELDVFLGQPQECSVFAIDPGEVLPLPPREDGLRKVFETAPVFGVQTCIAFARRLWQKLASFSRLTQEEEALDRFVSSTFPSFLAVYQDLVALTAPNAQHPLLQVARSEPLFQMAQQGAQSPANKGSSVYSAVIRPPGDSARVQSFPQGTLICKRGTLGDRLFILVEGVIEIPLGPDTTVQIARPGSVIGEIAVFLNLASKTPEVKRTADCICATPVRAIVLELDQVEPYLAEHPQLLTELLMAMAERTRETHALAAIARRRMHQKLFERLRYVLTGYNNLAHSLEPYTHNNLAFQKPFQFCAHQARLTYNRFREWLSVVEAPV